MCRHIEGHFEERLVINQLAALACMSRFHFARSFRQVTGVTPKQYISEIRVRALKDKLRGGARLDAAIYDTGYGSPSRVYEQTGRRLGMTPAQYRARGAGVAISYAGFETQLGPMMIGATDRGICFLQFGASAQTLIAALRAEYSKADIAPMRAPYDPQFHSWVNAIQRHLAGEQPHLDLPLDIRATAFQLRVWKYLQSIPYGDLHSYAEVAKAVGSPAGARAVARACANNVVALAIPCHRVIRGDGSLGGYRWGLERKHVLIDRERAHRTS